MTNESVVKLALAVILLAGCTQPDQAAPTTEAVAGVDGPLVIATLRGNSVMDARLQGRIVFKDDCVYLGQIDGGDFGTVIVWPKGATWQSTPGQQGVRPYPGLIIKHGDLITAGGGTRDISHIREYTDAAGVAKANSCGGTKVAVPQTGLKLLDP